MTEQWIPGNKTDLMAAIEQEWNLLMAVVELLTEDQMNAPDAGGWSPRDNIAHLTDWMKILMDHHMDKRPAHEVLNVSEAIAEDWDMEVINPILLERSRARSTREILNESKTVYQQLAAKLENMAFEELMKPRHADDPEKRPLLLWILGDTTEHFAEHRLTIEKSLKS
jgi:hypothetical protein